MLLSVSLVCSFHGRVSIVQIDQNLTVYLLMDTWVVSSKLAIANKAAVYPHNSLH